MRFVLAFLVLLAACSDDDGPGGGDLPLLEGTWSGPVEVAVGDTMIVSFELVQDESDVFGTLSTTASSLGPARTADVEGTISNTGDFTATLFYLDAECPGESGEIDAQLVEDDEVLEGSFSPLACEVPGNVEFEVFRE